MAPSHRLRPSTPRVPPPPASRLRMLGFEVFKFMAEQAARLVEAGRDVIEGATRHFFPSRSGRAGGGWRSVLALRRRPWEGKAPPGTVLRAPRPSILGCRWETGRNGASRPLISLVSAKTAAWTPFPWTTYPITVDQRHGASSMLAAGSRRSRNGEASRAHPVQASRRAAVPDSLNDCIKPGRKTGQN